MFYAISAHHRAGWKPYRIEVGMPHGLVALEMGQ
jgi:hypothetical protein